MPTIAVSDCGEQPQRMVAEHDPMNRMQERIGASPISSRVTASRIRIWASTRSSRSGDQLTFGEGEYLLIQLLIGNLELMDLGHDLPRTGRI